MYGTLGETLATSKRERKYKDTDTVADNVINKKYIIIINGERLSKYTYDSYYAAAKAADNLIKDTNDYYDIVEK